MAAKSTASQIKRVCAGCGACCREMCSPPFIPDMDDFRALPEGIRLAWELGISARNLGGWKDSLPCFWLDLETMRCRFHQWRPEICREFKAGSGACRSWRRQCPPRVLVEGERREIRGGPYVQTEETG